MPYSGKGPDLGPTLHEDLDLNGFSITGEGALTGGLSTTSTTDVTVTLTVADCMGLLFRATKTDGVQEFDLPSIASNTSPGAMMITILATQAQIITVDPDAADNIIGIDAVAGADGGSIASSGNAGDSITLVEDSAVGWRVLAVNGTWA